MLALGWSTRRYTIAGGLRSSKRAAAGSGAEHEVFADEEGIEAGGAEFLQIVVGAQSGFADSEAVIGDVVDKCVGSFHVNGERFQVAIVHADNARPDG